MSILTHLATLSLKGAGFAAEHLTGINAAGNGVEALVTVLHKQFSDNSNRLTEALKRSSKRAWRAVEISLAGRSWWDRCKVTLATGDDRAIRRQVQAYLDAHPLDGVDGHGPDFRAQCVAQLQAARKAGYLDQGKIDPGELARQVGDLSRFGDAGGRIDAEIHALEMIAANLRRQGYQALATFLTLSPASGPPLLVAAMRYFFRREVENDRELFQGMTHARLESLSQTQESGFADLAKALDAHSQRLEGLLADVQAVVVQTHEDVLDIKAELARQGQQMAELGQAVLKALSAQKLERRELNGSDSFSLRDENERRLVRDLVRQYRSLPSKDRQRMPALLNAVGKLEVMAGNFEAAENDFRDLAGMVDDGPARAEAAANAYRAALERRAWGEALGFLREAVAGDPARFAPFPTEKYEPEKILGAGGFGVAILCRNRHSGGKVVIKTLRRDGLDRDLGEVFREAQALEELEHPAIIRIRDCDYADAARTRPYFVMDYFAGQTLDEYVQQYGPLEPGQLVPLAGMIGAGLERAHALGILHRDVKPGNILVRQGPSGWQAKLIDFGLALRAASTGSTMKASLDRTLAGSSIAGTLEYAAPEQMGKLKGIPVGPYSDVFGFGKTCCFALFGTAHPTFQHWRSLPPHLAELLGRCLDEKPQARPQSFAEILSELRRPVAVPATPARAPILDVLPAAEEPVEVEIVRPAPARPRPVRERAPQSVPVPAPRPRREREPSPSGKRNDSTTVFVVLGLLALMGIGGFGSLVMFANRVRPTGPPSPPVPVAVSQTTFDPKLPMHAAAPRVWPPKLDAVEAIPPAEFAEVLKELKNKPDMTRLRSLAGRLAKTEPTDGQRAKHKMATTAAELAKSGGGPKPGDLERLQGEDDILQVSLALMPLLEQADLESRWYGATALQKWGTTENVKTLIGLLETGSYGGDSVRIAAAKALGTIRDPAGVKPAVRQMTEGWEASMRTADVTDALAAFGEMIEPEMWPLLDKRRLNAPRAKVACGVLERVGTEKSLDKLEQVKGSIFVSKQADAAMAAIKQRSKK